MNVWSAASLAAWLLLSGATVVVWWPHLRSRWKPSSPPPPAPTRTPVLMALVGVTVVITAGIAITASLVAPMTNRWSWLVFGAALVAALVSGGAMTTSILTLADASARPVPRVQRTILRGGTWIGGLERLGLVATVLAGWPEGVALIVAVKGLARYPELKVGQNSGAAERFIIGTFVSLGWAAACAGIATLLLT